jgi:xanthine dehydrogenase small subunit
MQLRINGRALEARDFPSHLTLLDFLRAQGLTGAKEGCAEGECGACAVALVAPNVAPEGQGSCFRAVNSCLVMLPMLAGQEVYTVEGLSPDGVLSAPQRAIAEMGGSQCGYCTPGFAVSLFAEFHRPGRTGACDPHSMGGNLCRCTGYRPLRDAALSLGTAPTNETDDFQRRLLQPAPPLAAFALPHPEFAFERPAHLADCLAILHANPTATLLAGATDLAVEANLRARRWPLLVSVEAVPELRVFRDSPAEIEIGAALPLSEIESRWRSAPPVFRDWFALFASPLIRNRATLGGNLATASPVGDAAPLLLALNAQVTIAGMRGRRTVPLSEFFLGYRKTALRPGEILLSVSIPKPLPDRTAFFKVAKRSLDDISTVVAAYALELDAAGRVSSARIAYGGVAATPVRVAAAEQALLGSPWNLAAVPRAQQAIAETLKPLSDHRGSAAYRLAVAQTLFEKFFHQTVAAEAA